MKEREEQIDDFECEDLGAQQEGVPFVVVAILFIAAAGCFYLLKTFQKGPEVSAKIIECRSSGNFSCAVETQDMFRIHDGKGNSIIVTITKENPHE